MSVSSVCSTCCCYRLVTTGFVHSSRTGHVAGQRPGPAWAHLCSAQPQRSPSPRGQPQGTAPEGSPMGQALMSCSVGSSLCNACDPWRATLLCSYLRSLLFVRPEWHLAARSLVLLVCELTKCELTGSAAIASAGCVYSSRSSDNAKEPSTSALMSCSLVLLICGLVLLICELKKFGLQLLLLLLLAACTPRKSSDNANEPSTLALIRCSKQLVD